MDLFEMVNGHVFPSVHALLIEPFKTIWEDDNSPGNEESIRIFTYIELLCSPKKSNAFFGYSEEERPAKVKQEVWGEEPPFDAETTIMIIKGVEKYKELLHNSSPSYSMFEAATAANDNLKTFLKNFDPNKRTASGALVLKPKDIFEAINKIPESMKAMELARIKINQEIAQEDSKTRNQREPGRYED